MSLLRTTRGGVDLPGERGALVGLPRCQIVVADPAAAPKHCRIASTPQGFVVTDLSGATVVNGAKVKEHVLRDGDVLQIGAEKFVFNDKKPEPVAARSTGSGQAAAGGRRPLPSRPAQTGPRTLPSGRPVSHPPKAGHARAHPAPKMTVKPGSVARVHKGHELFALPSTAKGRAIALTVAVALVLLVGGLFFISSKTVNSEEVRKLAKADIEAFEKIPENDFKKRLAKADEILPNENYLKYAKGDISLAIRLRPNLKQQVDLETRAESVVKPFLEKVRLLKEGPPEEYKKEWMGLYETAQAHLISFERTAMGPPLIAVRDELKALLENVGPSWREEISKLIREVTKLIDARNFSQGLLQVNDFGTRYGESDSNVMKGMLQGERERLRSKAKSWVDDLKGEAAKKTTKEDARKVLETARPFIKGFPDVEKSLDGYLSAYR
jgi:hypothetical protein